MATITAGERARGFTLPDLEGRLVSPLERGGGATLLVFFKDDCPTCRYAFPFLVRIHEGLASRGARIFGIEQDDAARARAFASDLGARFPILIDAPRYDVSRSYGVTSVPTCLLVGEDGVVGRAVVGFHKMEYEALAADLARGVGAPPPALFREGDNVLAAKPG